MTFSLKRHVRNPHASRAFLLSPTERNSNASPINIESSSDESLSIIKPPVTIHLRSDSSTRDDSSSSSSSSSSDESFQMPVNSTRTVARVSACRADSTLSMKRRMKRKRRIIPSSSDSSIESFSSNCDSTTTLKLRDQQLTSRQQTSHVPPSKADSTELVTKDDTSSGRNLESLTSLAERRESCSNQTFLCDNSSSDGSLLETQFSLKPSRTSTRQTGDNTVADSSPNLGRSNRTNVDEKTRTEDIDHENDEISFGICKPPCQVDSIDPDASSVDTIELTNRIKTRYGTQGKQEENAKSPSFDSPAQNRNETEAKNNFTLPDCSSSSSSSPSHDQNYDDEGDDDDNDYDKPLSEGTGEAPVDSARMILQVQHTTSPPHPTISPTSTVRPLVVAKQMDSAKSKVDWTDKEGQVPCLEIRLSAHTAAQSDATAAPKCQSERVDTSDNFVASAVPERPIPRHYNENDRNGCAESEAPVDAKGAITDEANTGNKYKTAADLMGTRVHKVLASSTFASHLQCPLPNKENTEVEDYCEEALRQEELLRLEANSVNSRSYPISSLSQVELTKLEDQAFFDGVKCHSPGRHPIDLRQIEAGEGRVYDHTGTAMLTRTTIYQGTRSAQKCPAFNLRSREFWNAPQGNTEDAGTPACPLNTKVPASEEFDFIDSYSDDERLGRGRPRRVTDILPIDTAKENVRASQRDSMNFTSAYELPPTLSSDPPRQWVAKPRKRRLLREAANNPFHAGSIARSGPVHLPPPQESILKASSNVWIRQGNNCNSNHPATLRNDLAGGSGVGAGSYVLQQEECNNEGQQNESTSFVSSKSARKRQHSTKYKKKGWSGKRGFYGKRGSRGRGKSTRSSNRGRSRNSVPNSQVPFSKAPQSRDDPLLRNVGGADITF